MNMILGVLVGVVVGWIAFRFLKMADGQSVVPSILIGVLGGGIGAQLVVMFGATDVTDGHFNVVSLVVSAASAAIALFAAKLITDRRSA